ncbi:MAG: nucleotide exchange factor GrpE [Patescibacteria group bacterium]
MPKKKDSETQEAVKHDIEAILHERDEFLDGWKRALADIENLKKQQDRDKEYLLSMLKAKVVSEILPIADNLEKAFNHVPDEHKESDWVKGVHGIRGQIGNFLTANGVEKIETKGNLFDPNLHEAVMQESDPDYDEGTILEEFEPGYKIGDKVIKYPKVKVSTKY